MNDIIRTCQDFYSIAKSSLSVVNGNWCIITNMIIKANTSDFNTVKDITQTTIKAVYPRYYPQGAVELFVNHHSDENISSDISSGLIYLLNIDGRNVGTVTVKENHINRLFVLPDCQHKGYGRELMDFAENLVFQTYDTCELDSSLPAKKIYLKRGYEESSYNILETENGDYLCFDIMVKNKD